MPLSEHEQRLLDEMERNLYRHDADVVSGMGVRPRPNYRAIVIGVIVAVLGMSVVLTGVTTRMWWVGILGFVIAFVGVLVTLRPGATPIESLSPRSSRPQSRASFMDRMNERWDRRHESE